MLELFKQLDTVLRGDATRMSALRHGRIDIRIGHVSIAVILAAVVAGACMGSFAMVRSGSAGLMQLTASAVKLPMLFILTLLVTFPSLYVFNALVGSRLTWESVLRLLIAANGVMLAVFASLGPIIVFFGLSTTSYPFMKLLNVLAAGVGGVLGLAFLLRTLHRLILVQETLDLAAPAETADEEGLPTNDQTEPPAEYENAGDDAASAVDEDGSEPTHTPAGNEPSRVQRFVSERDTGQPAGRGGGADPLGALERIEQDTPGKAKSVFRVWVVVYAIVGAQMGWVLRPFIGAPGLEFTFFRERQSNFFLDFFETLGRLFGG